MGTMDKHIYRAHLQCHLWQQAHIVSSILLDATTLGWSHDPDGKLVPLLTRLPLAPESVIKLIKCGCTKSMCKGRWSCREHSIQCTELCGCCANPDMSRNMEVITDQDVDSDDDDLA